MTCNLSYDCSRDLFGAGLIDFYILKQLLQSAVQEQKHSNCNDFAISMQV